MDQLALGENQGLKVPQDQVDQWDLLDLVEKQVRWVQLDPQERLVHGEMMVLLAALEVLEIVESPVQLDRQDLWDQRDLQDQEDHLVKLENVEKLDQQDQQVRGQY